MERSAFHRTHPVTILTYLSRLVYFLVIPFARGLFLAVSRGGIAAWAQAAWFDILVLLLIVGVAAIRWHLLRYRYDESGLYLKKGLLFRRELFLPMRNLSTVSAERRLIYRLLRAVTVRADTGGGSAGQFDLELVIPKKYALALLETRAHMAAPVQEARTFRPHSVYIAALSAFLSNSFAGVLFASAFISHAGTVLGEKLEGRVLEILSRVSSAFAFGIPPVAAMLALIILAGWFIGFLRNLLRLTRFRAARGGPLLTIDAGILTRRTYSVLVDKILYLDIRQSLMTKLLRIYLVFIRCVGYGKGKNEAEVLIPSARRGELAGTLTLLLPEIRPHERRLRPQKSAWFHYVSPPVLGLVFLPAAAWAATRLLPSWADVIRFFGLMLCAPLVWLLVLRFVDFMTAGVSCESGAFTLRYSRGLILHTVALHRERVALLTFRQSIFQRRSKTCDLLVYTYGEGSLHPKRPHLIKGLDREQAMRELFQPDPGLPT